MGVPKFFSWITKRYPLMLQDLDGDKLPEIDCLYLDMNGIIYKCSKDESIIFKAQVMSRQIEQIWFNIFNYICDIVDLIKPKKLLFLGLDGVAPRAKMNNQRGRRFRSAKDYKDLVNRLENYGGCQNDEEFKNNCITPGTDFMWQLNRQLRFFIQKKIQEDKKWQKFQVLFSGADVPGQGEHKIMDFIRQTQKLGVFNDSHAHCIYGADADLIMLAMALRIPKVCIIREQFIFKSKKVVISNARSINDINWKVIYGSILKQYFGLEYQSIQPDMKIKYDRQRIIDDFVFLCFFIGNDFLPRCYCYDIREGNLEILINGFKKFLKQCQDYIIHPDHINLKQLQRLTGILKENEAKFISDRSLQTKKAYKLDKQVPLTEEAENEFQQQFLDQVSISTEKLRSQQQFLLELKTLYLNDEEGARNRFYEMKLKFKPSEEPEKLNQLLDEYLIGLSYVHHYYFMGLPSWQWYYPYYYAPLVVDLHARLKFMNQNGMTLKKFQRSEPYEPFKQLLCILPRESAQLLPPKLQYLVLDQGSPLRQPMDYFPETVEVDPYGGLQSHQYISILPFIDQEKIGKIYSEVKQKLEFTDNEKERNKFGQNELYRYSEKDSVFVHSFYNQIPGFDAPLTKTLINFENDDVLKLKNFVGVPPETSQKEGQFDFPTLYIQKFTHQFLYSFKKTRYIELEIEENKEERVKLGSQMYFEYPYESYGKVEAFVDQHGIDSINEFNIYNYIDDPNFDDRNIKKDQEWLNAVKKYIKSFGIKFTGRAIYFIKRSQTNFRKHDGQFARSYIPQLISYEIVDSLIARQNPKYSFTKVTYKPKTISEQFQKDEEVVLLNKKHAGCKGIVTGYSKDNTLVEVRLTEMIQPIPEKIIDKINTHEFFFSINFVAKILQIDTMVLLDIIDSVEVLLDPTQLSAQGQQNLDIGLNLIRRKDKKIVPSLVRLPNQGERVDNLFKAYFTLEISVEAFNLLYEYKQAFPGIFHYMESRMVRLKRQAEMNDSKIDFHEVIKAEKMFQHEKDPNRPILQAYIWLLKRKETHEASAQMNSKAVVRQKVSELQRYFSKNQNKKQEKQTHVLIDPNYLFSQKLTEKGLVHLSNQPRCHGIADRVMCLNEHLFGEIGVIIAINDNQYNVLFQRPSFGKSNLQGQVDFLWGDKFNFKQLFNIQLWPDLIQKRFTEKGDIRNINKANVWRGQVPEFVAMYKSIPIRKIEDYNKILKINPNFDCKAISDSLHGRDRSGIDADGFQIVTSKRPTYKQYYPKEEERKTLNLVNQGADVKKVMKQFADKKQKTIKEEKEKPQVKEFLEAQKHHETKEDGTIEFQKEVEKPAEKPKVISKPKEDKKEVAKEDRRQDNRMVNYVEKQIPEPEPPKKRSKENTTRIKYVEKKEDTKVTEQKVQVVLKQEAENIKTEEVKEVGQKHNHAQDQTAADNQKQPELLTKQEHTTPKQQQHQAKQPEEKPQIASKPPEPVEESRQSRQPKEPSLPEEKPAQPTSQDPSEPQQEPDDIFG